MLKRRRSRSDSPHENAEYKHRSLPSTSTKRARLQRYFQSLSDELVLKIFSFLTTSELTRSQRVCQRFNRIAGDCQVWRSAFYDRFVLPRALKLPGLSRGSSSQSVLPTQYPHSSKWLDDMGLVKAPDTQWKQLYKLRHNWNRGSCEVTEIGISPEPSEPPLCVQMRMGIVFTADLLTGLQAWRLEGEQNLIARISLTSPSSAAEGDNLGSRGVPSALTIDENENPKDVINIAVGFSNGTFTIFQLDIQASTFIPIYNHPTGDETRITTMALSGLYLITMNSQQDFVLYHFKPEYKQEQFTRFGTPQIVTSLKSHTVWPPVSLSIRRSIHGVFACIIYPVPTFRLGWSVTMQELQLNPDGNTIQNSRTASAIPQGFYPITEDAPLGDGPYIPAGRTIANGISPVSLSQPTSISYSHPYLLTAHTDNTLTVYLVKSTNENLEITPGQQLFGHTSAVSSARIGSRGRAVSISAKGSELRVWELEGTFPGNRRGRESIKVYPSPPQASLSTSLHLNLAEIPLSSPESHWRDNAGLDRWLGFNEEKVIVHREKETGSQVLMVYDFS